LIASCDRLDRRSRNAGNFFRSALAHIHKRGVCFEQRLHRAVAFLFFRVERLLESPSATMRRVDRGSRQDLLAEGRRQSFRLSLSVFKSRSTSPVRRLWLRARAACRFPRHDHSASTSDPDRTPGEECLQAVIFRLRDWLELVIVATRALQRQAEERRAQNLHVPSMTAYLSTFTSSGSHRSQPVPSGTLRQKCVAMSESSMFVVTSPPVTYHQLIAGDLFLNELIERLVRIDERTT
jgi:hypothetical protein